MIVAGPDVREHVAEFVARAIHDSYELAGGYEAIGSADAAGKLIGGVVFTNYRRGTGGADIELWAAGQGTWITRPFVREVFAYPFISLGCTRCTTLIARNNKKSRRLVQKLGFALEGVARDAFGEGRDCMIYGMTRRSCRWIRGYMPRKHEVN